MEMAIADYQGNCENCEKADNCLNYYSKSPIKGQLWNENEVAWYEHLVPGDTKTENMADYNVRIKIEKLGGQDFEKRTEKWFIGTYEWSQESNIGACVENVPLQ